MSGASRQSFTYIIEDEYAQYPKAKETDTDLMWFVPPPGSWFESSHSRSVSSIYEVGMKRLADFNYGKISGTWQWTFVLDYNYLEPFLLFFEGYDYSEFSPDKNSENPWTNWGTHRFYKTETDTVRSFTVRRKRLHRVAGGIADEVVDLQGCVCTTLTMTQSAGGSETRVTLSGIYSTEHINTDYTNLSLDIPENRTPVLTEFGCVYNGSDLITNVQDWGIRIGNNVKGIYGVGYPCVRSYYEEETAYAFSLTAFANNPKQLAQRVLSGGYRNDLHAPINEKALPIPRLSLRSRSPAIETYFDPDSDEKREFRYSMDVDISDCTVNAMTWPSGDGSKLMDKLSNGRCAYMEFTFVNKCPQSYLTEIRSERFWDEHLIRSELE